MPDTTKGGKRVCPGCCGELTLHLGFAELDGWYECKGCGADYYADEDVIFMRDVPDGVLLVLDG